MDDILIVDDQILNLEMLSELLGKDGYQVHAAKTSQMAIDLALAHPPSLILLEVKMPEMDGFEICQCLKQDERTRDIPIIIVGAINDVQDGIRVFEAGGVDFISKPLREAEVRARVRTHINLYHKQLHLEDLVAERPAELEHEAMERKQTQESLEKSEENYRSIFETANDAIFIHDLKDGAY